jgi:hypothetical protein
MRLLNENRLFKYLKGKASDRKGLGMELALLVLLVVFACSTLLVSSALSGKNVLNARADALVARVTLDEYAERVLAGDTPTDARFEGYASAWESETLTITLDGETVLTVSLNDQDPKTIIAWTYH